ncbi:MAG: hypothetical protein WCF36_11305 [Candidatus Nanopelagicales bacterium]
MTNHPADSYEAQNSNDDPNDAGGIDHHAADAAPPTVDAPSPEVTEPGSGAGEDRGTADPVINRWATEHYGFEDESPPGAAASTPASSPDRPRAAGLWSRKRALLGAGALGLVLTGGAVGASVAANGDGPGGFAGRGAAAQVNADFDGDGAGGRRGGFR